MAPPAAPMVVTYLEMTERPTSPTPPVPAAKLALLRAEKPTPAFYRFLYGEVGRRSGWTARLDMGDAALARVIDDDKVEIYVLYAAGAPAGFGELDLREFPDIELVHFGVMAAFAGRGFSSHFLRWTIDQAWTHEPERLWVRTTSAGDAHLLALCQQHGFQVYRQEREQPPNA